MSWLSRVRNALSFVVPNKAETPDNLWHKCPACQQMIFTREYEENLSVCPQCGHHGRNGAGGGMKDDFSPTFYKVIKGIDTFTEWTGNAVSWISVPLVGVVFWEVFSRYALGTPHAWAFDVMIMCYGTLFMMAGAYTLSQNGHVRGDVLYGFFAPRTQATIDLTLYILFFIPGVFALAWAGYSYAAGSWAINEHSNVTADGPPVYPFKTVESGAVINRTRQEGVGASAAAGAVRAVSRSRPRSASSPRRTSSATTCASVHASG